MVQFSGFASLSLCIQLRILHRMQWVSPFGHRGIIALLPAPPRFSQAYTSFVAYHRQGIHHVLLFTWPYNFDVSPDKSEETQNHSRNMSGLSPDALCRIHSIRFDSKLMFIWRNQKFYVADGTVCTKPLRMCSFHQQRWFDSMNF